MCLRQELGISSVFKAGIHLLKVVWATHVYAVLAKVL